MNNEDITLSLGVDVSSVKGIDALIKRIKEASQQAIDSGVKDALMAATTRLKSAVDRAEGYKYKGLDAGLARAKRAGHMIAAEEEFVSSVPHTPETAPVLAAVYRRLRANRQTINPALVESSRIENAQRLEEINVELNRMRASQRYIKSVNAVSKWLSDTNNATNLGETPDEQVASLKQGRKLLSAMLGVGRTSGQLDNEDQARILAALEGINEGLREQTKATKDNTTTLSDGIKFAGVAGSVMGVAGAIGSGISAYSNIMAAGYGDPIHGWTSKRSAKASSLGTWGAIGGGLLGVLGGAIAGGLTGAGTGAVGGLPGSVAGAVIGAITGALKGGALGAGVGGVGGKAAGDWWGKNITRELSSQSDFINSYRWSALYGDRLLRDRYAALVETTGMATSADVEGLTNASTTIGAAAAFGGVSDQQWLALSMHPNYFAALMSGASEAELLTAYRKDAEALGPGMAQYFVGSLPGMNENLRAFAMSPLLGYTNADIQDVLGQQGVMDLVRRRGINAAYERTQKDYAERLKTWGDEYSDILEANPNLPSLYNEAELRRILGYPDNLTKRDLNIIIDGESHNVGEVYTDDSGPTGAMLQYLAGSAV